MLEIFPGGVFDSLIHTGILCGLLITWLLTETFGFVFAGFIVAGYLAVLGTVHPTSLAITVLEAILTYGVVWGVGRGAGRMRWWNVSFGRERFLLFILASIPVRVLVENLTAPHLELVMAQLIPQAHLLSPDELTSITVVLVPLFANAFWKLGLSRGLLQTGITASLTYLALAVLLATTDLDIDTFDVTFHSIAPDFLDRPKLSILLAVCAVIAAHNNVRFGWDYNGILVPALLAMLAFSPLKLATTLLEIIVLVALYRALLRVPFVRKLNLEGPRRLVSMYVIAYLLKLAIAVVVSAADIDLYVADYYGFGYLLTSLVAVKILQKREIPKVLVPTLITAAEGLVIAVALCLALDAVWKIDLLETAEPNVVVEGPLEQAILLSHATVRRAPLALSPDDQRAMRAALVGLSALLGPTPDITSARESWRDADLQVAWGIRADGARCLSARRSRLTSAEPSGIPFIAWCGGDGPALLVPHPLSDPGSLTAAALLAQFGRYSAVVVAGADSNGDSASEQRVLRDVLKALDTRSVVVIESRPVGPSLLDPRSGHAVGTASTRPLPPPEIEFRSDHGRLETLWHDLPRDAAVLSISTAELAHALEAPAPAARELSQLMISFAERALVRGTLPYVSASPEEALCFADLVVGAVARRALEDKSPIPPAELVHAAKLFDHSLTAVLDVDGAPLWVLQDGREPARGWGSIVFRPGATSTTVVVAPRAVDERGTAEAAATLFSSLEGASLWVAGSADHIALHDEGDALKPIAFALPLEPLSVRELIAAANEQGIPQALTVREQSRALWALEDIVISVGQEVVADEFLQLFDQLGPLVGPARSIGFEDGRLGTAALTTSRAFPTRYANALGGAGITLWLSEAVLSEVAGSISKERRLEWYRDLGVRVVEAERATAPVRRINFAQPIVRDDLLKPMQLHMLRIAEAPLSGLVGKADGRLELVDHGMWLELVLWGDEFLCRAAGASARWNGCWRLQ